MKDAELSRRDNPDEILAEEAHHATLSTTPNSRRTRIDALRTRRDRGEGGEMRRGTASTRGDVRRVQSSVLPAQHKQMLHSADAPADADAPSGRNIGQTSLCVDIAHSLLDLSNTPGPRSPDSRSRELQTTTRSKTSTRITVAHSNYVTHCAPPATLFSSPHSLSLFMPDTKTDTHTHTPIQTMPLDIERTDTTALGSCRLVRAKGDSWLDKGTSDSEPRATFRKQHHNLTRGSHTNTFSK